MLLHLLLLLIWRPLSEIDLFPDDSEPEAAASAPIIFDLVETPDGREFRHKGYEISAGGEMELFWLIEMGLLYRFNHRNYSEFSVLVRPPEDPVKRRDNQHTVSLNFDRPVGDHMVVSIAGSYTTNDSNIPNYEIDRFLVGGYLTYAF